MTDEHAHGEDETDRLEDEWHARMMPMTDEERKRIEALGNEQPIISGFVNTRSPFDGMDDDDEQINQGG